MFKINGELWRVVFCSPHAPELRRSDGAYALGACNDRTKIIYIRNDLSCARKRKVLCHEITHAAMFSYNIYLDDYTNELLADLFATYGEEIIRLSDNLPVC